MDRPSGPTGPILRAAVLVSSGWAAAAALTALALPELVDLRGALAAGGLGTAGFARWLVWLASVVLLGGAVWLVVVPALVVGGAVAGRVPRRVPGCPAWLQRRLLAACGVVAVGGLALGVAGAASAGDRTPPPRRDATTLIQGLPLPDLAPPHRVDRQVRHRAASATPRSSTPAAELRVRPGDTLWSMAARRLPDDAADRQIAEEWHRIYRLNRSVIGPDPDLIVPGTVLRLPADPHPASPTGEEHP